LTEILYFFVTAYTKSMKVNDGGGAADEQENIDVLEIDFRKAIEMIRTGEKKRWKNDNVASICSNQLFTLVYGEIRFKKHNNYFEVKQRP